MGAKIESDMGEMEEEETCSTRVQLYHKEEAKARIQADAKDRAGLRRKFDSCIDPMDSKAHPEGSIVNIMNIVSGKLAPASVNVENAVIIGETFVGRFREDMAGRIQQYHLQESGDNGGIMQICKDW